MAPYEADAQLAYLERVGIVDGILTEDSDLLVFGCKTVLFKLDPVASTVISISRKDFGSVAASSSDPNGISLIGWSDVQFRAMSILSGCDYLPSIPGVGLKTACTLLRKWRTAEQVVRAILLEGKKAVPLGYWKQFQLAEKCFLHQRVYCPKVEKLVHLTEVSDDWTAESDAYVGRCSCSSLEINRMTDGIYQRYGAVSGARYCSRRCGPYDLFAYGRHQLWFCSSRAQATCDGSEQPQ